MSAKALATVLAAAVGLFAIVLGISLASSVFGYAVCLLSNGFGNSGMPFLDEIKIISAISAIPVVLIALGVTLVVRPPRRLLRLTEIQEGPPAEGLSQALILLTLGMTLVGIFMLASTGPKVVMDMLRATEGHTDHNWLGTSRDWGVVGTDALQLLIGVYLFFGAKPICRWQMKRILAPDIDSPSPYGQDYSAPPPDQG